MENAEHIPTWVTITISILGALGTRELIALAVKRYKTPAESRREDRKVELKAQHGMGEILQRHIDQVLADLAATRAENLSLRKTLERVDAQVSELRVRVNDCEEDRRDLHREIEKLKAK